MTPIAIDSSFLSILLNPKCDLPIDPATGSPVDLGRERIVSMVEQAQKDHRKLILPTPATAEILTIIGPTSADYLRVINRKAVFDVRPFDEIAAIELAFLNRDIFAPLDKKNGLEPWQKMKVDRQIIAVSKVAGCEQIFTEDTGLGNRARLCGIQPVSVVDLPIPESARQHEFQLDEHEEIPDPPPQNPDNVNGEE